jgi:hypothetical protein
MKTLSMFFCLSFILTLPAGAAEYFVGKQGNDSNSGQTRDKAFLTIQKGVSSLQPGDILSIGSGEYPECVKLENFGSPDKETVIRAEIPGTVLLRGDRNADLNFKLVSGRRFVYAADYDKEVLSVNEVDTLMTLAVAGDMDTLEFSPGKYYCDAANKKLYLSSSDFQTPDRHRYTIGNLKEHGLTLRGTERVVLDGLSASGYLSANSAALLLPSSGFLLHNTKGSIVRRCTAFFNGSGITLNSDKTGQNNIVTDCRAYANHLDGIVIYNPSSDTIRDSQSFLNRTYGARFYGGRRGDSMCTFSNLLAWGNPGGDYWFKGSGLGGDKFTSAERCIALMNVYGLGTLKHCILGGGDSGGADSIRLPGGAAVFYQMAEREFADPMNFDFRLQSTSQFYKPGKNEYMGPYPFEPNIFYVKTDGNDSLDGLSMSNAWKSLSRAFKNLRPNDTLYIAGGRYSNDAPLTAKQVKIRGRGIEPVFIDGAMQVSSCDDVLFERLNFAGPVSVEKGSGISFSNCVFSGIQAAVAEGAFSKLAKMFSSRSPEVIGMEFAGVNGLKVNHGVFKATLKLKNCSKVFLSGNVYAASPAVLVDRAEDIIYSAYNSYPKNVGCWDVKGKMLSFEELQKSSDAQSFILPPELAESSGEMTVKNAYQFAGHGPLGTSTGLYREWQPKSMQLLGPFVQSTTNTTANLEWWTTLPADVELSWGDTPDCANKLQFTQSSFYTHSLIGLEPGKKYYVKVKPTKLLHGSDPARRFQLLSQDGASIEFTTAQKADAAPQTYYVSNSGNNEKNGLSLEGAWQTLQYAADHVRPGDTVLLAGGKYSGTVYFRVTGEKDKPITFKAIPGEKAMIDGMGEKLKVGLVLYGKNYYNFDSLYIQEFAGIEDNMGGAENGGLLVKSGSHLQVTRCYFGGGWGPNMIVSQCDGVLVKNCIFGSSMGSTGFSRCPNLRVENNVFISPLITHIGIGNADNEPSILANNIFTENTRGKVQVCFVGISKTTVESNNCFYIRWPENERNVINNQTLPEYRVGRQSDSIAANPMMPGTTGWTQGWGPGRGDFNELFATNPEIVKRGIGLQPEAFRDFHFKMKDWTYDAAWADKVLAAEKAAAELVKAGKDAEALTAYTNLAAIKPLNDRLKTEFLDQASLCANRLKQYDQAMVLAKQIPLKPFSVRRQMTLMLEQKKYSEIIAAFCNKNMGGETFHLHWRYPELEDLMSDLFYYRSIAYTQANDLAAAEADLKAMVEKRANLAYSPGEAIHEMALLRLGDFYRTQLKDDARAMEVYGKILDRTMLAPYRLNVISKPAFTGSNEAFIAATKAASEILNKQGKQDEVLKLQISMLKAQAEAFSDIGKKTEAIANLKEVLASKGVFGAEQEACEKRINELQAADRKTFLQQMAAETSLFKPTQQLLINASDDDADAEIKRVALRALIAFAPLDKIKTMLTKIEEDAKNKGLRAKLEPTRLRMREMEQKRQWKELIEEFKDLDLAGWPDDMAIEAFRLRGNGYCNLKNGQEGETQLKKGIELSKGQDSLAWFYLAENYQQNMKDNQKALDAYLKVVELLKGSPGWINLTAVIRANAILRGLGRNDEALKIIESIDRKKMTVNAGTWRIQIYSAYLDTLAALGRKADAVAECGTFLKIADLTAAEKGEIEKKLKELQADASQPPKK